MSENIVQWLLLRWVSILLWDKWPKCLSEKKNSCVVSSSPISVIIHQHHYLRCARKSCKQLWSQICGCRSRWKHHRFTLHGPGLVVCDERKYVGIWRWTVNLRTRIVVSMYQISKSDLMECRVEHTCEKSTVDTFVM